MTPHLSPRRLAADPPSPEDAAHLAECSRCRVAAVRIREFMGTLAEDADPLVESLMLQDTGAPPSEAEVLPAGTRVDRYEIEGVLGRGGMGVVYRARHTGLGSLHAIKVLRSASQAAANRLLTEGRVQATVRSRHIVPVTDVVNVDGSPGLVMELIDGPSLEERLKAGRIPLEEADALARGVLAGVAAAHRAGVIHRDLKPANVLLAKTEDGEVPRITDFGLVKVLAAAPGANDTQTDVTMGTPRYMAPEQIRSARLVDRRADVWALGCILYELVTGAPAFDGADLMEIFIAVTEGRYRPVRERAPDAPGRMVVAIEAALRVDREERVPDVESLAALWTGGAGLRPSAGGASQPPAAPVAPAPARRWAPVAAVVLGALLLGGAALAWWSAEEGGGFGAAECEPLSGSYMPMAAGDTWLYKVTDPETGQRKDDKRLTIDVVEDGGRRVRLDRHDGEGHAYRWLERAGNVIGWVHDEWIDRDGNRTRSVFYDPIRTRVDEACEHRADGATWTETYDEIEMDPASATRILHRAQKRVEWRVEAAHDRVELPIGTFDAIKVRRVEYENDRQTADQTYWFSPGVGKVKEDSSPKEIEELLEVHVGS